MLVVLNDVALGFRVCTALFEAETWTFKCSRNLAICIADVLVVNKCTFNTRVLESTLRHINDMMLVPFLQQSNPISHFFEDSLLVFSFNKLVVKELNKYS